MRRPNPRDRLLDPAELGLRLDSVPAGGWITFVACSAGLAYVFGWADEHKPALAILLGIGFAGGIVALLLPWQRIVRSRWREVVFLAWSLIDVAIVIALAGLDGGADSPLALLLFIPIVFAGMSYPRTSVTIVSGAVLGAYLGMAFASGPGGGTRLMFAASLACVAIMSYWQARNQDHRRELLLVASQTDPLTDSLNRRGFEQAALQLLAHVARFDQPASLALFDLDRFKDYNDAHGHAAGDDLLCWVVKQVAATLRPTDSIARVGGDEFAVLLAGADGPSAQVVMRRVADALSDRVEVSCGLASAPADGQDLDALYKRADEALYEAKRARVGDPEATTA